VAAADTIEPDLPKVTLAHLQRAETRCAFRLRAEHFDAPSDAGSNASFAVAQRLEADVRLTHARLAAPTIEHLRPDGLAPEAAATYRTAARWYIELFGDEAVRAVDDDDWSTEVDALGIRLVGPAGLAFEDAHDRPRLRFLRLAARDTVPGDLTEWSPLRFALVRRRAWIANRSIHVQVADLLHGDCVSAIIEPHIHAAFDEWLAERVAVIRARIEEPRRKRVL
jgi:hypothetical protein